MKLTVILSIFEIYGVTVLVFMVLSKSAISAAYGEYFLLIVVTKSAVGDLKTSLESVILKGLSSASGVFRGE